MAAETELAAKIVAWLTADGWDVYQEVSSGYGDSRADIVAVREPVVIVVECKNSLTLEVMGQAYRWLSRGMAHQVYVAVPLPKRGRHGAGMVFSTQVLKRFGIGLLQASAHMIYKNAEPLFQRRLAHKGLGIRKYLNPAQKTWAKAGSKSGHWTPFKETCERLRTVVAATPGVTMKDAVAEIDHHYRTDVSARSSLTRAIINRILPGIRIETEGKAVRLYPA